jgi:hypothetical protein
MDFYPSAVWLQTFLLADGSVNPGFDGNKKLNIKNSSLSHKEVNGTGKFSIDNDFTIKPNGGLKH